MTDFNTQNETSLQPPVDSFSATIEGRAIRISLVVGLIIVLFKTAAYYFSGSMALMADMLESFVHNLAVIFAGYCLWLSFRPADDNHLYGHGKSQFLSAGVEGGMVCFAALVILFNSAKAYWNGYVLFDVAQGAGMALGAACVNALLGGWLISTGKKQKALILVANGKHVLSDVVTTAAALIGMVMAWWTQWIYIDLLVAIAGGIYIFGEGFKLLRQSIAGLLDEADRIVDQKVRSVLQDETDEHAFSYHALRHRSEGNKHWMEIHLVMDDNLPLQHAHELADHLESVIHNTIDEPITITTHLEPKSSSDEPNAGSESHNKGGAE